MQIDMPTTEDIAQLAAFRDAACVSIYFPTSTVPADAEHTRLAARNLFAQAMELVDKQADTQTANTIREELDGLLDDREFWTRMGRSLAIFVSTRAAMSFRLPNLLTNYVSVSDRFAIIPLLRAVTFPHAAHVLAISQNDVRLIELDPENAPRQVDLPEMPSDAASTVNIIPGGGRPSRGRLQGAEGRKVKLAQYARAVEQAIRPLLNGTSLPLVLAAAEPMASIYRNVNAYAGLVDEGIPGNVDSQTDNQLGGAARKILDDVYAAELVALTERFAQLRDSQRAITDLSDLARAATTGAIDTLVVNMEESEPGEVSPDGALVLEEGPNDVLEEITRRAIGTGARVLAVRAEDVPAGVQAAAVLRYT